VSTSEYLIAGSLLLTGVGMIAGLFVVIFRLGKVIQRLDTINGTVQMHNKDITKLGRGQSFLFGKLGVDEREVER